MQFLNSGDAKDDDSEPTAITPIDEEKTGAMECPLPELGLCVAEGNNAVIVEREESGKVYWEVDKILDWRLCKGVDEYLVQWQGSTETTWEPQDNLGDSAFEEAIRCKEAMSDKVKRCPAVEEWPDWSLEDGPGPAELSSLLSAGELSIDILTHQPDAHSKPSFASVYFEKRVITFENPLRKQSGKQPKVFSLNGFRYELLSCRIK